MPFTESTTTMKKAYSFIFYLFTFAAVAFLMPNVVLYYQGLGFSGLQIGMLAGIAPLITLIGAPLWTGLADAKNQHKFIMSLILLGTICLASIFPLATALTSVLIVVCLFSLFSAPILSFADHATMTILDGEKEKYGRVRMGGTIGFAGAATLAGIVIQANGIRWAFWGFALSLFLAFLVSLKFTFRKKGESNSVHWDLRYMITDRRWWSFLALAFTGGAAITCMNNYLFPYMAELGASRPTMGIALTISTLIELPVLFFSNLLLRRFNSYGLFMLGIVICGVRLLLYALFSFTAGVLFFQPLNGLTFPILWVAGVAWVDENAPAGMKATGQGLLGAMVLGIGSAAGGFFGGLMLESIGGRWMYLVMGSFVLVFFLVITLLGHIWQARKARSEV